MYSGLFQENKTNSIHSDHISFRDVLWPNCIQLYTSFTTQNPPLLNRICEQDFPFPNDSVICKFQSPPLEFQFLTSWPPIGRLVCIQTLIEAYTLGVFPDSCLHVLKKYEALFQQKNMIGNICEPLLSYLIIQFILILSNNKHIFVDAPRLGYPRVWGLSNINNMVNKWPHSRAINSNLRDAELVQTVPTVQVLRDVVQHDMAAGNIFENGETIDVTQPLSDGKICIFHLNISFNKNIILYLNQINFQVIYVKKVQYL